MSNDKSGNRMIMRLFQVKAKKGREEELLKKFATTSAAVVMGEPGNKGYIFGRGLPHQDEYGNTENDDMVMFASFWKDLDSVKKRFGDKWQVSFLPEGYEDMIEECSVRHIDVTSEIVD